MIQHHHAEFGEQSTPKFRNEAEAHALNLVLRSLRNDAVEPLEQAILSPYAQQIGLLRDRLDTSEFRSALLERGLTFARDPRGSGGNRAGLNRDGFFTVDSFQGNQAKIIAVSMVRNNKELSGKGLGFLVEPPRMNVLISRAERLLILVGSWEFDVRGEPLMINVLLPLTMYRVRYELAVGRPYILSSLIVMRMSTSCWAKR